MSIPLTRSRYKGEFVVKDITNNRQYLADLLFSWDVGDNLSAWSLAGNTLPTVASNGWMDFYDNTAGRGYSAARTTSIRAGQGEMPIALSCKIRRMPDDSSTDGMKFCAGLTGYDVVWGSFNIGFSIRDIQNLQITYQAIPWVGSVDRFRYNFPVPADGTEHIVQLFRDTEKIGVIFDGVLLSPPSFILNVETGNSAMSYTPHHYYCLSYKYPYFWCRHNAGEVTHFQVRDIKFGRLVGVGDV